jgi:hypothetical protein
MAKNDPLISAIDAAVVAVLKTVDGEVTVEGADPPSARDRIAALESAMKWAEMRSRIVPDGKEGSKFGGLKSQLREAGGRRGRGTAATEDRPNGHDSGPDPAGDADPLDAFGAD